MLDGGFRVTLRGGIRRLRNLVRRTSASCWQDVDDLLRALLMGFVLRPAADLLPRKSALAVAGWCASVMLHVPSTGRPALMTMKKAFRMEGVQRTRNAREYLAQPFYTFVITHRLLRGLESIEGWKIEESNNRDVIQLRDSGQSFIVATGHFVRHAVFALYFPNTTPWPLLASVGPLPAFSLAPSVIRIRLQFGQYLRGLQHCRSDIELVFAGAEGAGRKLLGRMKGDGANAIITADAFWNDHNGRGLTRPFAGHTSHTFATGAATLGRLAQCPVLTCAPYLKNDGTIVLEWGPTIQPPPRTDKEADIRNTNLIVEFLEGAIGRRPSQYTLFIGEERRWNAALQQWEDPKKEAV
jgi:lauroyl/myristoyl acyltransferase